MEEGTDHELTKVYWIERFVERYGRSASPEDVENLLVLLRKKNIRISERDLANAIDQEYENQLDSKFQNLIFDQNPQIMKDAVRLYLDYFDVDDYSTVKSFAAALCRRGLGHFAHVGGKGKDPSTLMWTFREVIRERGAESLESALRLGSVAPDAGWIDGLTGTEFEEFLSKVLTKAGFLVTKTPSGPDQGADLILKKGLDTAVVQAKCYGSNVGNAAVQEIVAAVQFYGVSRGIVVTNRKFTTAAMELALVNDVELVDRDKLLKLISEHW